MISAEDEQARAGHDPAFFDSLTFDLCDGEHDVFAHLRMDRLPGRGAARASALVFRRGALVAKHQGESERDLPDWDRAELDPVRITTETPLERWTAGLSGSDAALEVEAEAASAPVELSDVPGVDLAATAGVEGYEQICTLRGEVSVAGKRLSVSCRGLRRHLWGSYDWSRVERWRSLYAAAEEGGSISIAAVRPAGSDGHGDELRAGHLVPADGVPLPFDDIRLSTVYGNEGFQDKAGLELYMEGDEYPRRVAGVAVCGATTVLGDARLRLAFFRWMIDGRSALGGYEVISPA
jgi:hypothetical protein